MDSKLIGGILLVIGTAIGGGMLALPIATAEAGFVNSLLLMFICWFIMTASALLVLEANLWLPARSNIISMARNLLGRWAEIIAWFSYLLLFYSVIAAYIAGGGDFFHSLIESTGIIIPIWLAIILFTGLFGFVVYQGIRSVDYVNRGLMSSKAVVYVLLVAAIMPFVSFNKLLEGNLACVTAGTTVMVTSFTFANIIPSLRTYFHDDVVKLRKAILIGSIVPLICYLLWDLTIMGIIPRNGNHGLISMLHSGRSTSEFVKEISRLLQSPIITLFAKFFTSICLATSFLASALGLSDFLADGLQVAKQGKGNLIVYSATFLPPLTFVLFSPHIFIAALGYAGIYCVILLVLLPTLMVWRGRYYKNMPQNFRVVGGKFLLLFLLLSSIVIIVDAILNLI